MFLTVLAVALTMLFRFIASCVLPRIQKYAQFGFMQFAGRSLTLNFTHVCGKHFSPECFVVGKGGKCHLSNNTVPSVFSEWSEPMKTSATPKKHILERVSECQHVSNDSSAEDEEKEEEEE